MLKLEHVEKKIYSKDNENCFYVLKDINLLFPSNGMNFIYGDLNSGVNLLFDVLGGNIYPSSGKLYYFDELIELPKDFSIYSSRYVSYVFLKDCLVTHLSIEENLRVFDENNILNEVILFLKLSDILKKYPNDLNEFEYDKVTIAKALVKQSKIILAHIIEQEMDIDHQKELYQFLKEISKDKLVICISNNVHGFYQFSDRNIQIENGKIILDESINTNLQNQNTIYYIEKLKKYSLSNRFSFIIAKRQSLQLKKHKRTLVLFLLLNCLFSTFLISILQYNPVDAHEHQIITNNYEYFKLENISNKVIDSLSNKGIQMTSYDDKLHFDSLESAEQMGIHFYPTKEILKLDENTYFISDQQLNKYKEEQALCEIDGQLTQINEHYNFDDLIGCKIISYSDSKTLAGVYVANTNQSYIQEFYGNFIEHTNLLNGEYSQHHTKFKIKTVEKNIDYNGCIYGLDEIKENCAVITDDDFYITKTNQPTNLVDDVYDRVYVDILAYNLIMGTNHNKKDFISDYGNQYYWTSKGNIPISAKLKCIDHISNESCTFNLRIQGIVIDLDDDLANQTPKIYFSNQNKEKYDEITKVYDAWVQTKSVKNLKGFLNQMYHKYNVDIYTPISDMNVTNVTLSGFEKEFSEEIRRPLILLASLTTTLSFIIMIVYLIYQNNKHKLDIITLKNDHIKMFDIFKINFYNMFIISIPIFISTIFFSLLSGIYLFYLNQSFSGEYFKSFQFIDYHPISIVYSLLLIMCLHVLSALVSFLKIVFIKCKK